MSYRKKPVIIYVPKTEEPTKDSSNGTSSHNTDQPRTYDSKSQSNREGKTLNSKDAYKKTPKNDNSTAPQTPKTDNLTADPNSKAGTKYSKAEEEKQPLGAQSISKDEAGFQKAEIQKDPIISALREVLKVIPTRFRKPTDQLYTKLKTRSQNNEQVLFMLAYELFDPYNLYELQCMISLYCHLLLDKQHNVAHSYLIEFKFRLKPNLAKKIEYLPAFLDFMKLNPLKAKMVNFPADSFFPEEQYLRITDLGYTKEQIQWIDFEDQAKLQKALTALKGRPFAIDGEWKPYGPPRLALLQIANSNNVFLFDMLSFHKADGRAINDFVSLFRDANTTKIFFGSREDINQISNFVNGISKKGVTPMRPEEVKSIVDLQLALQGLYDLPDRSLKSIAKYLFKKDLNKLNQCSNWNWRPLRESQRHYAALDAIVTYKIYEHLLKEGQNVQIYSGMKDIEVILDVAKEQRRLEKEARFQEKEAKRQQRLKEQGIEEGNGQEDMKFEDVKKEEVSV